MGAADAPKSSIIKKAPVRGISKTCTKKKMHPIALATMSGKCNPADNEDPSVAPIAINGVTSPPLKPEVTLIKVKRLFKIESYQGQTVTNDC